MLNVDINQAKESLPELIEKTFRYGDVIIAKDGNPIAKLVSIPETRKQRKFDTARGLIKLSHDFDQPYRRFQGIQIMRVLLDTSTFSWFIFPFAITIHLIA